MENYSKNLQNKIITYYEKYYQDCGLKDFKERAKERLNEEVRDERKLEILSNAFNFDFKNKGHLIVGAGTAGLAVVLKQKYSANVFGIEPSDEEFEIIKGKCCEAGLNFSNFKKEFAEKISFKDNFFDFVFCVTVLEHVKDVEKSIKEMIRVLKPGGFLYIETPNYKFPVEKHYKIIFPTFLPKFFGKIYLFLRGKPIKFIDSINFLTEKKLNRILFDMPNIVFWRIYRPGKFKLAYSNQEIIIRKIIDKL